MSSRYSYVDCTPNRRHCGVSLGGSRPALCRYRGEALQDTIIILAAIAPGSVLPTMVPGSLDGVLGITVCRIALVIAYICGAVWLWLKAACHPILAVVAVVAFGLIIVFLVDTGIELVLAVWRMGAGSSTRVAVLVTPSVSTPPEF